MAPSADKQTCDHDTVLKPLSLPIKPEVKGIEPYQDEMVCQQIYIYIYMYLLPLIQRDIEHMLQIKMARKRKGEVGFSWTDDELQFPLESSLDFKSKCEFQGES